MTRAERAVTLCVAALAALAACTPGPNDAALCAALARHRSGVEVIVDGRVTQLLGIEQGPSGAHEGFLLRTGRCRATVRVESSIAYTGIIPLHAGERVEVKGEFDDDAGSGVIHFTHRELRGRHPGGYVKIGGTYYW